MGLRPQNKVNPNGAMSSMTDLVFLLLIFFIILATQAKVQPSMDIELPQGGAKGSSQTEPVRVYVNASNEIIVDNDKIVAIQRGMTKAELDEAYGRVNKTIFTKLEDSESIQLWSDESADWGIGIRIISICKENKWKVAIMTKDK